MTLWLWILSVLVGLLLAIIGSAIGAAVYLLRRPGLLVASVAAAVMPSAPEITAVGQSFSSLLGAANSSPYTVPED
jgi:hypothetical protein